MAISAAAPLAFQALLTAPNPPRKDLARFDLRQRARTPERHSGGA